MWPSMILFYQSAVSTCRVRPKVGAAIGVLAAVFACGCGKNANQYLERGNQEFAARKYDAASINYRNAIKKDPRSGEAYYRLSLALLKQNQYGEAYQALNHAVELSPQNIPAKVELANLSLTAYAHDPRRPAVLYNRAKSVAQELLKSNPNSVEGLRLNGGIALLDNRPDDAVEVFRRALQASSGAPDIQTALGQALMRNRQTAEGEHEAQEAIAHHPEYIPAYDLLYSQYLLDQRWADAESLLKLRISNNPKDPAAILRLAGFYLGRQKPEDAEKMLGSMLDRRDLYPQADLLAGDFHAVINSWDKALADYQRGLSRDKEREKAYQERMAAAFSALGRREEAGKTVESILLKDPKDLIARALKVSMLLSAGGAQNLNAAAALSTDLTKEAPTNPGIQMITGQAALAKGELDAASARFQHAARLDAHSPAPHLALARVFMLRKNYPAMLEQTNAALTIKHGDENARLFRIIALTGTGAFAEAKTEAERLAGDTTNSRQIQMQLGIIALGQKHYAEAESYFQKLYSRDADVHPLAGLVSTYVAENLPDRALQLLEAEEKRAPGALGTEALTAATAQALGKLDLALSKLQTIAAQAPDSAEVQIRIGDLQRKQGNMHAAIDAYQRAQKLDPKQAAIDAVIASAQEESGDKDDALVNYRKALVQTPDDPYILNNLAYLLTETGGDLTEALRLVTVAVRKAPDNPSLQDTLAWIHIQRGNPAAAMPILSSLTDKYPNNATFRYHFAAALLRTGDRTEAKQQLETALSEKPPQATEHQIRRLLEQAQ